MSWGASDDTEACHDGFATDSAGVLVVPPPNTAISPICGSATIPPMAVGRLAPGENVRGDKTILDSNRSRVSVEFLRFVERHRDDVLAGFTKSLLKTRANMDISCC
jgi:hypothetical protein